MNPILKVKDLHVSFHTYAGEVKALRGVNFELNEGETLAIVGESGSGKSVTTRSIMRILPPAKARITHGEILFEGKNLLELREKEMQLYRGSKISMVFQDPMSALNPTMTIGKQLTEGIRKHLNYSKFEAKLRAIEQMKQVGIANAETRFNQYPHQFSGGMRQRIMIAMALLCNPKILIADEPTTALDVTVQAQILDLMKKIQERQKTSIILITHDLGVVASMADRVVVMYGGMVVESGTVEEIFYEPKHPYTWGLLMSVPKLHMKKEKLYSIPGRPPDLLSPPSGCPFAPRCAYALDICGQKMPHPTKYSVTSMAACWLQDVKAAHAPYENLPKEV
ncbi:ABC transporter ATP-binding protein [Calidifontibacillus erzurumensis]|uniref:ABC transporter ATP-binding protein n=1 Tax=Calidifontibacillus erzurumensis TaxID=2741433 RepID=A0A8J8GDC8_9BACI|nr:ABC transporter ATP-binding protein [Calidifontibacillus erzurumensis]NSL51464.1 ABC transporter ATP-binding protein [Calidifontibacillus erzurumensis]